MTAPASSTLRPMIPVGVGPSRLLFVESDIHVPTSPITSQAPWMIAAYMQLRVLNVKP